MVQFIVGREGKGKKRKWREGKEKKRKTQQTI